MNLISESWSCPSCGTRFNSTPPEHRLCRDCLSQLQSLGYEPAPGAPYGDLPPCPDCGGQQGRGHADSPATWPWAPGKVSGARRPHDPDLLVPTADEWHLDLP